MKNKQNIIPVLLWLWVIVAVIVYLNQFKGLTGAIVKQLGIDLF